MPTVNQVIRGCRDFKKRSFKKNLLAGQPQRKAVVLEIIIKTPRKPNSACRRHAKVMFKDKSVTVARIKGIGHNLQPHDTVLVCGGGSRDVPGSRYSVVGGAENHEGSADRRNARSKIGTKKKSKKGSK